MQKLYSDVESQENSHQNSWVFGNFRGEIALGEIKSTLICQHTHRAPGFLFGRVVGL